MTTTPTTTTQPASETLGSFAGKGMSMTFDGLSPANAARHFEVLRPWVHEQAARHNVTLEPCWHLHMAVLDTLLPLMFRDLDTRDVDGSSRPLGFARSRYVEELYSAVGRVARLLEPCGNLGRGPVAKDGPEPWWAAEYPAHRVTRQTKEGPVPESGVPGALVS